MRQQDDKIGSSLTSIVLKDHYHFHQFTKLCAVEESIPIRINLTIFHKLLSQLSYTVYISIQHSQACKASSQHQMQLQDLWCPGVAYRLDLLVVKYESSVQMLLRQALSTKDET